MYILGRFRMDVSTALGIRKTVRAHALDNIPPFGFVTVDIQIIHRPPTRAHTIRHIGSSSAYRVRSPNVGK